MKLFNKNSFEASNSAWRTLIEGSSFQFIPQLYMIPSVYTFPYLTFRFLCFGYTNYNLGDNK